MKRQKKPVHKDLQGLYQEAPVGLCSLDTNLRYLQINNWLAELNGLPVEAHLGRTIREVLPDVAAGVEQQLRKVIETGEPIIDGRVDAETPAYPGVVRNFQHHYYPIRSEGGRIVGVSCVVADISERRLAEEALRKSEEQYQDLYENAPDMFVSVDAATGTIIQCNRTLAVTLGYSKEALIGSPISFVYHPDCEQGRQEVFRMFVEAGEVRDAELQLKGKDGSKIDVSLNLTAVRDEQGHIRYSRSIWRDITERRRAEEALRQAHDELETRVAERTTALTVAIRQLEAQMINRRKVEVALQEGQARFHGILDIAHEGIISIDAKERILLFNQGAARIFGYASDEVLGQSIDILLPERARHRHSRHIAEFAGSTDSARRMGDRQEIYGRRKTGQEFPAEASISKLEVGGERIFTVVLRDITERKQSEETLRVSEERYRTLVESSPYCIHEIDLNWQLTSINPAGLRMMGVTLGSEVIGRPYLTAVSEEDQDRVGKLLALACKGESSNFKFLAVNGRHFQSYVVPIDNDKGAIVKLVGLTQDISEEILAKEALRHLSGRVIKAQEEERGHIARELHDDIGQRLALIAVDIQLLTQADHQPKAEFREQMDNLRNQIETLSSEVHNLSHQLHPANLEQLGLVPALKSFFREMEGKGMVSIKFSGTNIPATLSSEISLCLYRIVQEAIWNVVKHSRATQADVELTGEPKRVCLRIGDSGVGFDPEMIQGKEECLGIVSMQERIRLVGGEITIHSQPSQGTRIDAHIPLTGADG